MDASIRKRFRKEVQETPYLRDAETVFIQNIPQRNNNTRVAQLLFNTIYPQKEIILGEKGIICGSREEAALHRLYAYTRNQENDSDIFLSSITREELARLGKCSEEEIYFPATPEAEFFTVLAHEFPDVRYGL